MYFNKQPLPLSLPHSVIQEAFCINGCHYWSCDWGDTLYYGQHGYLPSPWQMTEVISFIMSLSNVLCQLQLSFVFHCPPLAKMRNSTNMVDFTAKHKINVTALSGGTFMTLLFYYIFWIKATLAKSERRVHTKALFPHQFFSQSNK